MVENMIINERQWNNLPYKFKDLFEILPNDGSEEITMLFPYTKSGAMKHTVKGYETENKVTTFINGISGPSNQYGDSGNAARFFIAQKLRKRIVMRG